ncbi:hypothetical protein [Selenihalanaerobacter shriftii]|uniref:Uncharacterized protein n=1 Tax=Selenihalanaerobacter shriftii TaxID=142842 RepID=A0A1T4QLL0_9FIRM|nr:hypothetical protein [Selenihalanaerobacter shriftii]SKA04566.1 hypothetical protein SAMN02745118_02604 [Selenihalanaerobacter shriftii]
MLKKVFLLLILFCLLGSMTAYSNESDNNFVLFIIDQVSFKEILETPTPNIDYLIKNGSIGLMNSRTSGSLTPPDTYLTIGAGRRANTGVVANYTFNVDSQFYGKSVNNVYQALTGNKLSGEEVVNIRFSEIIKDSESGEYNAQPGLLGKKLGEAGVSIAVVGNSDYQNQTLEHKLGRTIGLVGINPKGSIGLGDIGQKNLVSTDQYPFGFLTNQRYIMNKFNEYKSKAKLIIVESGDTARVESVRSALLIKRFIQLKKETIQRADELLGKVLNKINLQKDQIMIATPTPSDRAQKEGRKLTLTILAGKGVDRGLLTSSTTKRSGIIANVDIAPTILDSLNVKNKPIQMIGNPIYTISTSRALINLKRLNDQIIKTFTWRPTLIKGFILLQIIILILAAIIILFKNRIPDFLKNLVEYFLIVLLVIPLFLLLSKYFISFSLYSAIGLFLLLSLGIVYLLKRVVAHEIDTVLIILNLISGLLIYDLWNEAGLIKRSVLGYSPVIGARFYGIGNEFMGLLIGTVLIGITGLFDRFPKWSKWKDFILPLLFILVILTIGHPKIGANFGGLLTSLAAFTFTYVLIKGYQFNVKQILFIIILVGVAIGGLVIYDTIASNRSTTHIGRTVLLIKNGGFSEFIRIIHRKVSMNLKLLQWTIWTKVILSFIFILAILFKYPAGVVRQIIDDYSFLRYGFSGVICGSIVTMLVNDSGVVATATLLLPAVVTFVYLVIRRFEL